MAQSFKSTGSANLAFRVLAGNCLAMAQGITGAPVMYASATDAANATRHRHHNKDIPNAMCVLWFDHWGSYGLPGREVWANWGHVVVYVPGQGYASSSPVGGEYSTPYYYASINDVEQAFNCTFRFWSEDINGKRVCAPAGSAVKHAATKRRRKSMSTLYYQTKNDKPAGQGGTGLEWALAGDSPGTDANWLPTTQQSVANDWAESHGNAVFLGRQSFAAYRTWYKQPVKTQ